MLSIRRNRRVAGFVAVAAATAGLVAACGSTLDTQEVTTTITTQVQEKAPAGSNIQVTCPDSIKAEAGATFTCKLTIDGQQVNLNVTQQDDKGNLKYEPAESIIDINALQTQIRDQVTQQLPGSWTVTCDAPGASGGIYVVAVGGTLPCTISGTGADGAPKTVSGTATITDNQGTFSFTEN